MPCVNIGNAIICYSTIYKYKGYFFDWHKYCGPTPLKKNGDVKKNIPRGFWDMMNEFSRLNSEEQEKFREF